MLVPGFHIEIGMSKSTSTYASKKYQIYWIVLARNTLVCFCALITFFHHLTAFCRVQQGRALVPYCRSKDQPKKSIFFNWFLNCFGCRILQIFVLAKNTTTQLILISEDKQLFQALKRSSGVLSVPFSIHHVVIRDVRQYYS